MNIHEYQAKQLLKDYGAPVSDGRIVLKADEAKTAASELDGPIWVVKAQIHAGGRGKGRFKEATAGEKGGVRITKSVEEASEEAQKMLGRTLVTHQTGPAGKVVNRVYIEDGSDIARELYLALLVDRARSRIAFVCSTEGGMDIEEVAAKTPDKILSFSVDPASGISGFHGRRVAFALGLEGKQIKQCVDLVNTLYRFFVEKDCEMLEINPLIVTTAGDLKCLDAKMGFDSNALYRQPDIMALRDETEEDPKELAASKFDLNYIALDGEIGCMVNGAGLAMATMDIIKLYGGRARELPRRGRRRHQGEGDRGVQDHHLGPQREGDSRQHLRRHHALRRDRRGRDRRGEGGGPAGAAGGAAGGDERRAGEEDPERERPFGNRRRRPGGRGGEDREGGEGVNARETAGHEERQDQPDDRF